MKKIPTLTLLLVVLVLLTCLPVGATRDNELLTLNHTNETYFKSTPDTPNPSQFIFDADQVELLKVKQKFNFDGNNVFKIVYLVVCGTIIVTVVVVLLIKIHKTEKNKRNKK